MFEEIHYIDNCRLFRCPLRWDALTETEEPGVKHCPSCEKNVYFCESLDDARERAANNQCVAIHDSVFARQDGTRSSVSDIMMGGMDEGVPWDSEFGDSGPSIDVPAYVQRWRERTTRRR